MIKFAESLNGLSQSEQNQQIKAPSVDEDGHKEGKHENKSWTEESAVNFELLSHPFSCTMLGESAPSERQVSPDKLYRAALLRSRFADTILKAQEKTLDKVLSLCCIAWHGSFTSLHIYL